jgi:hypothetical protein
MDTTLVKLLLAAAILLVLWNAMSRYRRRGRSAPRGYFANEFYDDEPDYAEGVDEEVDDEEVVDDEGEDSDYEDGEDEDYEDDEDDDDEDGEDEDYEDGMMHGDEDYEEDEDMQEGYSNAGAPLLSASAELLPKQQRAMGNFSEFAPKGLKGQNFLDASKFIGVNTQGSSLRNANYDLRSAPSIARKDVGPWSQSTIDPDPFRKPLE